MARIPIPKAPSGKRCPADAAAPDEPPLERGPGRSFSFPAPVARFLRLDRLDATDRTVLGLYLLTRVGILLTVYCAAWMFTPDPEAKQAPSFLSLWARWDWGFFQRIAENGYFAEPGAPGSARPDNREAFFPGLPMALRAVHTVVPSWTLAGLLISFAAGAVAAVALSRTARLHLPAATGERVGPRAALFLLVSPCTVFLAAGYTEALFLAFALPAWLAARKDRWALAGTLGALATTVRISGLFLAAALAVQFLLAGRERRRWRSAGWLAVPALPALAYSWYLQAHTGDWMAWKHAQERGWYRQFHTPWEAWLHTWDGAFSHLHPTNYAAMFQAELVAMVVGVLLLALLIRRRQWPEVVYMALSLWALGTSYWYMSVPRATLLWWPLWVALAVWSVRRPWIRSAYLGVAAPLATVLTLVFTSGKWAG
ncbi:mannosyltransferase family protein [Streptomyces sp. I05A-00742]|uniref:mannosyltransferase family protein n=1 Tax=Streptomyces sp. I05A-00742 TaxID=2732853 RepID=UPI0014895731|nr:mannosyltransferase family protein [Streptomyces sp. I05A-00742]